MEVGVRSDRGLEIGQVLCEATADALSHLDRPPIGSIVRQVSDDDSRGVNEIDANRSKKLDACQRHIDASGLDMKLIEVEQLLGGERLIVYYIAEERVDFRELVRTLAAEFKTRIEMRQIGVRDEAKVLADYGDCGKPVCCNTHLSAMPPVSMKMAKLQKATLDPTKISGRCGRLKCCLRYEYDNYVETQRQLPRVGARVVTRNGTVKVLNQQILAEQLLVETEDHRRMVIDASEVLSEIKSPPRDGNSKPRQDRRRSTPRKTKQPSPKTTSPSENVVVENASQSKVSTEGATAESESSESKPAKKNGKRRTNRNRRRRSGPKKENPGSSE